MAGNEQGRSGHEAGRAHCRKAGRGGRLTGPFCRAFTWQDTPAPTPPHNGEGSGKVATKSPSPLWRGVRGGGAGAGRRVVSWQVAPHSLSAKSRYLKERM